MGNLTNQYVSQSFQGLLTLANANTGVTSTLQSVQDGLGNNLPIKVSNTQVTITGSFFGDGSGLTGITVSIDSGSLVTTSSFNAYTSSNDAKWTALGNQSGSFITESETGSFATTASVTALSQSIATTDLAQNNRLTSIESVTGSLQNQINQKLDTGSFNTYTSSNDNKVNSLIASTGSYATTSSLTALSQSIASTDLAQNNRLTALEGVTGSINRNGLITTGSIGQTQSITGSLNVEGTISATSASFTYVNTVYETASVIYSSGSNQFGDASNDTQTLWGTVNLPSGPLVVTGSVTATNFTGSLQGTASYATNALSSSHAINADTASYVLNAVSSSYSDFAVSSSQAQNAVSASFAPTIIPDWVATTGSNVFNGLQTIDVNDVGNRGILIRSGSGAQQQSILFKTDEFGGASQPTVYMDGINSYWQSTGNLYIENAPGGIGSGSMTFTTNGGITFTSNGTGQTINLNNGNGTTQITGSAKIIGNTTITGSLTVTGSARITGSFDIRNGDLDLFSNNTTVNTSLYLTSSLAGQANMFFGWGDNPQSAGAGATQANYTGSLRITGSNNIVSLPQIRATGLGGGAGLQGYISGSHNIINGNSAGIYLTTSSLLSPKTSANFLNNNGNIQMTFTTSSLAAPIISQNGIFAGGITLNHPSGTAIASSNIMVGQVTSTQNFVTNTVPSITSNNILGSVTLNHVSSSISYTANYSNAPVTVNNHLSSSNITNNSLAIGANHFIGGSSNTGVSIWVSGSQSSNVARNIIDNIIGGKNITVSSSFVSSSNSNLVASVVYGQNLSVSGSHASTVGGSAFFGRYNGLNGLEDTQNIVFAVGTGTGTSTRRTGLWITSGSLVGVSGSMAITGAMSITGSDVNIKGITQETGSFVVTMDSTGSLHYAPFSQVAAVLFSQGQFAQTGTLTAASGVSGSVSYDISGSVNGITLVSGSRLTIPTAGVYDIQFSAQWDAASGADTGWAWFKKNGTNIANSNSKVQLPNNTSNIMTVNILETAAVGDYYEVAWQNNAGHARLLGEAASGNLPAIPSVITTIKQIR